MPAPVFDLDNIFGEHEPTVDQNDRMNSLRGAAHYFATVAQGYTPVSAEQILGFRKIQEALMYFKESIVINEAQK